MHWPKGEICGEPAAGVRALSGIAVVTVARVTSAVAKLAKLLFIFG